MKKWRKISQWLIACFVLSFLFAYLEQSFFVEENTHTGSTVEIVQRDSRMPDTSEWTGTTSKQIVEETQMLSVRTFIEVKDSCDFNRVGTCVKVRSGPSTTSPVVAELRNGIVLETSGAEEHEGRTWYKIIFNEWVRYPERVTKNWFVAKDVVDSFTDNGAEEITPNITLASSTKHILIKRSEQALYAYEGDVLVKKITISTGLDLTPTPRGQFIVYRKTPTRYMQGPLPGISPQYYDLPGVPWNLYFTREGGAIHGAYWHNSFGRQWSHGCVNLQPTDARELYYWAPLGTPVLVTD